MEDYTYIEKPGEHFICPICLDVLINPIIHIECGNTFCSNCLKLSQCPICQNEISKLYPAPKNILNYLDELKIKCNKCNEIMKRNNFNKHLEICIMLEIECVLCNTKIIRKLMDTHLRNECPNYDIECEKCFVKCKRKDLSNHINIECIKSIIICSYCKIEYIKEVELKHIEECTEYPINCILCEENFPRHLINSHNNICPMKVISCKGSNFGCSFTDKKLNINNHELTCIYSNVVNLYEENKMLKQHIENMKIKISNYILPSVFRVLILYDELYKIIPPGDNYCDVIQTFLNHHQEEIYNRSISDIYNFSNEEKPIPDVICEINGNLTFSNLSFIYKMEYNTDNTIFISKNDIFINKDSFLENQQINVNKLNDLFTLILKNPSVSNSIYNIRKNFQHIQKKNTILWINLIYEKQQIKYSSSYYIDNNYYNFNHILCVKLTKDIKQQFKKSLQKFNNSIIFPFFGFIITYTIVEYEYGYSSWGSDKTIKGKYSYNEVIIEKMKKKLIKLLNEKIKDLQSFSRFWD